MANCVNVNHPDVKTLSSEFNIEPIATAAIIGVWQNNNTLDRFPNSEEFKKELKLGSPLLIKDKVSPVEGLTGNTISTQNFIETNKFDEIEVDHRKRGDKTYTFLFNKAKEYDISIKGRLQKLSNDTTIEKAESLAGYNKVTNEITLDPKYEQLNKLSQSRILAHELIHGIISKEYAKKTNAEKNSIMRDTRAFVNSLENHRENNPAINRVLNIIKKSKNLDEIITYGLTDTEFASELNAIILYEDTVEIKPRTFWDKLKELILSIISDDYTKMDELINILDYHFNIQEEKKFRDSLNNEGVLKQKELYNKNKLNTYEKVVRDKKDKIKDESTFEEQVMQELEDKLISVINKMGASYEEVDTIVDRNGQPMNTLGKADLLNQVVRRH